MTALLEHQRIDRRPPGSLPAQAQNRTWRSVSAGLGGSGASVRTRTPLRLARRGSERLDELIRRQAPTRSQDRPVRNVRRVHAARVAPHARVRVQRKGRVAIALSVLQSEAREFVSANWRLLGGIAAGALCLFGCIVLFASLSLSRRVPQISLSAARSADAILLEGRLPQPTASGESLEAAVVKILRVRPHDVQAGETLSEIASRYGLRLGTVINFNGITDVRSIPVGKKLSIPNADGLLYRVVRGDSLARIAKTYGVSSNALMDWNDLQSAVIKPGDRLFVPGASMTEDSINAVLGKLFIYPTRGELTSGFGNRMSPIYHQILFHNGIDLHNRTGTPVVAARSGRVVGLETHPVYGKTVLLSHSGGYQTMYAHLDTMLVRRGQTVAQGEQIGAMGSTGSTTGPHLHFSVFRNAEPIDPLKLLH